MRIGRGHQLAALVAAMLVVTTLAGPVAAQGPSPSAGAASGTPSMSATPTAPPSTAWLPTRPTEVELPTAATTPISDAPVVPPSTDVDLASVGAASAARVESMPIAQWSLVALMDSFEGDPARAFAFVRDSIAFDAYRGVLRGAEGTLAARAGNAWDRAILLRTLLEGMALSTRYATVELDESAAARVAARILEPVAVPLDDGAAVVQDQLPVAAVAARARRDYALLRGAVGERSGDMRALMVAEVAAETRDHVWVQVRWGADWLDYDPTFPDGTPGSVLAPPTATSTDIPDDLVHRVTLRVVAGAVGSGGLTERTVLERSFVASEVADRQVFLYFQPELSGLGGGIVRTLSGVASWTPVLMVDGEAEPGQPFEAGGRGTDLFGDPVDADQLATLRIEVTRSVPGRSDETATHVLLDRVPSTRPDASDLTADELLPMAADDTGPLVLGVVEQLQVSTGGASAWQQEVRRGIAADFLDHTLSDTATADDRPLGDLLYPLAVANASLVLGSERLSIPALGDVGRLRGYVSAPRAYLASIGQDPLDPAALGFGTALLLDDVRVVAAAGAAAADGALAAVWYGTLQSALETEDALARAGGLGAQPDDLVGTSLAMTQPLAVATQATSGPAALRAAIAAGALAIVPGDPGTTSVWWTIDPGTGSTRAILDPGRGGVHGKPAWGSIRHRPPVINRGGAGGANTHWLHPDGSIRRYPPGARPPGGGAPQGPPPSRCGGGQEYVTIVGCVSIPAAWAIRIGVGLIVTAVVTDAIIVFLM